MPDENPRAPGATPPRRALVVALAVLSVVLLVANVLVLAVGAVEGGGRPRGTARTTTTTTATSAPPVAGELSEMEAELARVLPELKRFVERATGLAYRAEVAVSVLDDAAFRERLRRDQGFDPAELRDSGDALAALGLLPPGYDIQPDVERLFGGAVAGFYDPKTDELVVRGDQLTIAVQATLVHELTHALQDQHFNLERPELDDVDDERALAASGLTEGDAVRVERAWLATRTDAERREAQADERRQVEGLQDIPEVLVSLLVFPYLAGPGFVDALIEAGGLARVHQAFRERPTTSEHLLHPETYLRGEGLRAVPAPPAPEGSEVFDEGVFGEFGVFLMLEPVTGGATAQRAAAGWGGDRYVAWRQNEDRCFRMAIVMDREAETRELLGALDRWRRGSRVEATVEGEGPVTVTSCVRVTPRA